MSGPNDTVWAPQNQEGEFSPGSATNVADSTNQQLVDASGTFITDDGTTFTPIAQTTWSVNDTA